MNRLGGGGDRVDGEGGGGGLSERADVLGGFVVSAVVVVTHRLGQRGRVLEPGAVAGQDKERVEADEPLEGGEVLDKAAPAPVDGVRVGFEDRVRGDAGEQVVAGEQDPFVGFVEGDVADGVAGGDVDLPVPSAGGEGVAVVEKAKTAGVDGVGHLLDAFVEGAERVMHRVGDAESLDDVDHRGPIGGLGDLGEDRKSTRLNSSHYCAY